MNIADRIKARRNELQMSQRELSDRMGYNNHSTIARIEAGKVDIPQSRIVKFAEVLGVSVAYLMGWEEEIEKNPVETAERMAGNLLYFELLDDDERFDLFEMIDEYKTLSDSKKTQVREYVHFLSGRD